MQELQVTRIEAWRRAQGLTYDELGKTWGVTGVSAHRICGEKQNPSWEVMRKIEEHTGGQITAGNMNDRVPAVPAKKPNGEAA